MKIKRYFAPDMRQAIRMVREEQEPDAVILSNRRVDGGVEIVAAIDYDEALVRQMTLQQTDTQRKKRKSSRRSEEIDALLKKEAELPTPLKDEPRADTAATQEATPEPRTAKEDLAGEDAKIVWSQEPNLVAVREEIKTLRGILESQVSGLAWGNLKRQHPLCANLLDRLVRLGLSPHLCQELANQIDYQNDPDKNWRAALALLGKRIRVTNDDILTLGGVVALVGPTGVGKTTTVAKLAARYTLRHGPNRVALVTTDSYRIGAHQQLKTYGRILGVPVHVANDSEELRRVLGTLRDKPLVLIDTAGMSQRDMRLSEQFGVLKGAAQVHTYIVLSATTQRSALEDVIESFRHAEPEGCILTKVDETTSLGEAISVIAEQAMPVAYLSDGQRVPEDIQPARPNTLVSRGAELMQKNNGQPASDETLAFTFGATAGNFDG